jgi:hypothetical protein
MMHEKKIGDGWCCFLSLSLPSAALALMSRVSSASGTLAVARSGYDERDDIDMTAGYAQVRCGRKIDAS